MRRIDSFTFQKLFLVGCLATGAILPGCSPPQEPATVLEESDESQTKLDESTEVDSTPSEESSSEESNSTVSSDAGEDQTVTGVKPETKPNEAQNSRKPDRATSSASRSPQGSGDQRAADFTPATPAEAAGMAEKYLSVSENSSDLATAYRHASQALHCARQFPGDSPCLRLADAALGRLKSLEVQAGEALSLPKSGILPEKAIVEIP